MSELKACPVCGVKNNAAEIKLLVTLVREVASMTKKDIPSDLYTLLANKLYELGACE